MSPSSVRGKTLTTRDHALLEIANTSRQRSYGYCRICGSSTEGGYVLTVGLERTEVQRPAVRLAQRGRTFCSACAETVLADLIEDLERTA